MTRHHKKKTYRVAIIGCGRIASLLEEDPLREKPCTHAGAFHAHPKTKIVAGCDIKPERLKAFGEKWEVTALYGDYRKMLKRERPDIVSVAAWTEFHSEMVVEAVKAGVKGIYCEKPVAANLSQARRMIKACEEKGVSMVVGHERRWDKRHQVVRDAIQSGEYGALRSITGYTLSGAWPKLSRKLYGGGPMFHDGTHLVDLFRFFGGDVKSVTAVEDRPNGKDSVENTVVGIINFKSGARGLVIGGGERKYFHFELDVQMERARMIVANHTLEMHVAKPSNSFTGFTELEKTKFPDCSGRINPFVGGVEDLITQMETGAKSLSGGRDGLKALEIILALYRSAGSGGALVKLPLR
ncbi:MAG: Gfo/Idh/MocA family oxidoreductase [Nitrospinae bacterium]|nr:Gfo/Idh/MocA family oxidoreductase [Nitrospinota bacterium]